MSHLLKESSNVVPLGIRELEDERGGVRPNSDSRFPIWAECRFGNVYPNFFRVEIEGRSPLNPNDHH